MLRYEVKRLLSWTSRLAGCQFGMGNMKFKSSALGVAFRVVASMTALGAATLLAGTAMAALTATDEAAVPALTAAIEAAVNDAIAANVGADEATVQAAVEAAVRAAVANADPEVANVAMAAAVTNLTNSGALSTAGVGAGLVAQQQVILTAAVTEAVTEAVAAGATEEQIELAIAETVDVSGVTPAVAQLALNQAQTNLSNAGINSPAVTAAIDSQIEVASNEQSETAAGSEGAPPEIGSEGGEPVDTTPTYGA